MLWQTTKPHPMVCKIKFTNNFEVDGRHCRAVARSSAAYLLETDYMFL